MTVSADPAGSGVDSSTLEIRLHELLANGAGLWVAAAESCTGGEIGHRITSVAGSSDYFLGSVVAYANSAKEQLLGVPRPTLDSVGAVSPETAAAMSEGACKVFGADIAVSTTGIAGPGGATARKPVGLVYIGLTDSEGTTVEEHHFSGNRTEVVNAAAQRALELIVAAVSRAISSHPPTLERTE